MTLHYINEQTSSLADLMTKLATFVTSTAGWTGEAITGATNGVNTSTGEGAFSKAAQGTNTNDIQVAFQWDTTDPDHLAVYQYNHASGAGNYDNTRAGPWDQDGDSGNGHAGTADADIDDDRHVRITDTPIQYWAFAQSGASLEQYVYVVVEYDADRFNHFGFGEVQKFNDWDGGAFAYGQRHQGSFNNSQAVLSGSTALLDGLAADGGFPLPNNMEEFVATLQIENLPQQVANGMWAVVMGGQSSANLGTDRQSNDGVSSDTDRAHFVGGFRANEIARSYGNLVPSPLSGYVPAYPIMIWYWHRSPSTVYGPMGVQPNVRGIAITNFAAGDEITVGSEVWKVFPTRWRSDSTSTFGTSRHQGIAYRKS